MTSCGRRHLLMNSFYLLSASTGSMNADFSEGKIVQMLDKMKPKKNPKLKMFNENVIANANKNIV
jgi:hypothetical protein